MEVSNFSALCSKPGLNRPRFSTHTNDVIMSGAGESKHLPVSCMNNGGNLGHHLCIFPLNNCSMVLGGKKFSRGAKFLPVFDGVASRGVLFGQESRPHSTRPCNVTREESGGSLSGESILLNEQTLERELKVAIQEENYAQAAKLRDSLRLLQEDSKASVLAANARFYNSFRNGDLAAMQALWSEGEHVCVVHPGVSGISGYDLVMGSWEFVWADYEFPLEIEIKDVQVHVRGDIGYVTCIEMVRTKGTSWGRHFSTNVFEKVGDQWFICIHHASYVDL